MNGQDVCYQLQQNWVNFFWLTGETLDTFNILVDRLRTRFDVRNNFGCDPALNLPNQVTHILHVIAIDSW